MLHNGVEQSRTSTGKVYNVTNDQSPSAATTTMSISIQEVLTSSSFEKVYINNVENSGSDVTVSEGQSITIEIRKGSSVQGSAFTFTVSATDITNGISISVNKDTNEITKS